ncbi:indole-3-glycerol phosphate synthase TrpC [Patescibacteria group bacterium]|nr:indole-3-glycerol phosphate synthase TrpC [Patescibacteria group bacterium]
MLERIVNNKMREVEERKKKLPLEILKHRVFDFSSRNFKRSISSATKINIIAEIKRFSPSAGIILRDFDPSVLAKTYEENGASAISVLIDEKFFGGSLSDLAKVRKVTSLPILAKEFILDEYQIYEAKLLRADAILLIASILSKGKLRGFLNLALRLNLDCIVEIHKEEELDKIDGLPLDIIGINNRDLKTFKVDLKTTFDLIEKIPSNKLVVSESGIKERKDIHRLREKGINAFLIGKSLLKSEDMGKTLREFLK